MSEETVRKLHAASMEILEKTGMRFLHPDANKILQEHGVKVVDGTAHFTEDQIMEWVGKAPHTAKVYAADPRYDIELGNGRTYTAPAAGPVTVLERDGSKHVATLEDLVKALRLYEANPSYSINGGVPCQPKDVDATWSTLMLHYVALLCSNKVTWTGTGFYDQMEATMDLTRARFGQTPDEMREKPYIFSIVNTDSPLRFDLNMTESLFTFLKYRVPVCITAAGMAGTTTPMTLAGTLAVTNAEIVAAIALAQMYAPGAPVLYGSQTATADMRGGAMAIGAPEAALCYKYCAELARFYGVPCRGGGALTDAKKVDVQAGYESMLTLGACVENGMSVCFQSAGILNSYLDLSFDKMVADFEVIDYLDRYKREFEVDGDTVPLDLIDEVGPGGQYLVTEHTLTHCRTEPLTPHLAVRGAQSDPAGQLDRNIDARMQALLGAYEAPAIDEDAHERMRRVLRGKGIPDETIAWLDSFCAAGDRALAGAIA